MTERDLADLLRRRDPLFGAIYVFNLLPARYVHASWLEAFGGAAAWAPLRDRRRAEPLLSQMLLEQLGPDRRLVLDFADPAARLALIDGSDLSTLIDRAGLTVHRAALASLIDRAQVLPARHALGEEAWEFALRRAPLLAPPERTAPPALVLERMPEQIRASGLRCLAEALAGQPAALLKRVMLKLPRRSRLDGAAIDAGGARERALRLFRNLIRDAGPRWTFLFA